MPALEASRPTEALIDLDALAFNFHSVRDFVGRDVRMMAVVKANAYGHGAVECARRLEKEGADWFAVATIEEAAEIRTAGIQAPVLCLGGCHPGQEPLALDLNITPTIITLEAAERLNSFAADRRLKVPVHVKIDTGMGRVGIPAAAASQFAARLVGMPWLSVQGLMTHFAAADDLEESEFTNDQIRKFQEAVRTFEAHGIRPEMIDLANSPGAIAHPRSRADLVRIGGILYGLGRDVLPTAVPAPELRPVLSFQSRIAQVKRVDAGTSIGYGRTFTTTRESLIGSVPIGYHDGFRRALSNRGRVIINRTIAPVVGRVSMDWITVDLTDVPAATIDDRVTIIGAQGDAAIIAEDLAEWADTISYEITCGISSRVPRRYSGVA